MSNDRRKFLRNLALGTGALGLPFSSVATFQEKEDSLQRAYESEKGRQRFNMSGYKAPAIDNVRIGFIGLGMRGSEAVRRVSYIDGITIKAVCDKLPDRAENSAAALSTKGFTKPATYTGDNGWKEMIDKEELDLVYICSPWSLHTPMAVYAMQHEKHVACEVPIAVTLDECWELVETSEKTRKHCMMLENCCYDFFEMLTLNMARNGMFGELVHAEGAYIHDLRDLNFKKDGYVDMWRLKENYRNGNLYPTHGLGPIAQCLNINRGDKMSHLVSMSGRDFMMADIAEQRASTDAFYKPFEGKSYRGNMNTTLIYTDNGKTIMVQHDVTSPRPYSRLHLISGTKGVASKYPSPEKIAFGHSWLKESEMKKVYDEQTPPIIKHVGEIAKKVGGHGGMDFIMDWRLIDCLRNGLALDQDVYDGALWSAVAPLTERSVAKKSRTVDVPDFTRGAWKTNAPVSLTLNGGATTGVREVK